MRQTEGWGKRLWEANEGCGGKDGGRWARGVLPGGDNRLLWTLTSDKPKNESAILT